MKLTKKLKTAILKHAEAEYPRECCGLLILNGNYIPCTNQSTLDSQFAISPQDYVAASEQGEIVAIVHSHPDSSSAASDVDKAQMALHGLPWVIVGYPQGDFAIHQPTDYTAPLLGREYYHGLQDCYSLCRDYYHRECDIRLSDYVRDDCWWELKDNPSLYLDNFKREGFIEIDPTITPLQKHDAILCRVGRTEHVNHAVIYLGDGQLTSEQTPSVVGDNIILHHPYGRLSVREIWGEMWAKRAVVYLRHKDYL